MDAFGWFSSGPQVDRGPMKSLELGVALGCMMVGAVLAEPVRQRPNIIFILADDLGYGDLACYNEGSKIPTPHLDRLASEGIRFTNAYCPDAVCTPSRYALMTGRYSWRTARRSGVQGNWERPLIEEGRLTVPALLRRAGYVTGGFGKWHLGADFPTSDGRPPEGQGAHRHPRNGQNLDLAKPLRGGPLACGFDVWYGFICASESLVYDGAHPVAVIDVYPAPLAVGVDKLDHIPVASYLGIVADKCIEFVATHASTAREGRPFFLFVAPYAPHVPLAVPEQFKGRTRAGDYGDYVHALDHHVGRLLAALDQHGLTDDTLVLFASDNGSEFVVTGDGHRPNGTLRGRKHTVFEGGVRTPLLARWPTKIRAGAKSEQIATLADMLASLAALTGQTLPKDAGEDSFNLLPAFLGRDENRSIREHAVLKASSFQLALRVGGWKYIAPPGTPLPGGSENEPTEQLYDLESDPGETKNVAANRPRLVSEMKAQLDAFFRKGRTAPLP